MTAPINIRQTSDGVLVPVRVVTRASRTEVDGVHDGAIRIRLNAPPVDGAANKQLCTFIADLLRVPKNTVEISSGLRGRVKTILVRNARLAYVREKLRS
jgi:uncharacterized protein